MKTDKKVGRPNPAGFTLIELMVTLLVIGIVFLAFTTTFAGIENISKKGTDVAVASQAAFAKLEEYENLNFNTLQASPYNTPVGVLTKITSDSTVFTSSLPTSLQSPRVGEVYINTASQTLKQIVVRVTFGSGPEQRFIEYTTFIQKYGLGR